MVSKGPTEFYFMGNFSFLNRVGLDLRRVGLGA